MSSVAATYWGFGGSTPPAEFIAVNTTQTEVIRRRKRVVLPVQCTRLDSSGAVEQSRVPWVSVTRDDAAVAQEMTTEEVAQRIAGYERMFGMSSEEFLERVRESTAPDTFETNVWMVLLKYR
jgi:hypothetical protein